MSSSWKTFDPRREFGSAVTDLGSRQADVVLLAADLARTCNVLGYQEAHPERFLNVGICEQNMVGMAAGLALEGKVPFVTSIAPFVYMRPCEQVRTDVCYNNLHVVFVSIMAGISGAPLGSTHYGLEDLSIMRSFANMTVLQPSGAAQVKLAIAEAYAASGPVYIRLGSGLEPDVESTPGAGMIGNAIRLRDGSDVAIHATGYMVHKALEVADQLAGDGLSVAVWDHPSIKPIDAEAIRLSLAPGVRLAVALEEHTVVGGFGSAVAEQVASLGTGIRLVSIGIPDVFVGVGDREGLAGQMGLSSDSISGRIRTELET